MKKKLNKKELEKVSGGHFCPSDPNYPSPGGTVVPDKRAAPAGILILKTSDIPGNANSEQSEGNPGELPLPK